MWNKIRITWHKYWAKHHAKEIKYYKRNSGTWWHHTKQIVHHEYAVLALT